MSLVDLWARHPRLDLVAGIVPAVGYFAARLLNVDPVIVLDGDGRSTLYGSLVTAGTGALAFVIIPASIIVALVPGERLRVLIQGHGPALRAAVVHGAYASVGIVAAALLGLATDATDAHAWSPIRYITAALSITMVLALLRIIDQFSALLSVRDADNAAGGRPPPHLPHIEPPPDDGGASAYAKPRTTPTRPRHERSSSLA